MSYIGPCGPVGGTPLQILDAVSKSISDALNREGVRDKEGNILFLVDKYVLLQANDLLHTFRGVICLRNEQKRAGKNPIILAPSTRGKA